MRLEELQNDFLHALLEQNAKASFFKNIQKGQGLSEFERFDIYQESIIECLANVLRETYSVCEKLVGNDFFTGMVYEYIERTPSTSPNLFNYGHRFAEFVSDFELAKTLPYLSDICQLEWAWYRAYYAAEQKAMDFNALSNIPDERQSDIVFELSTGSTLLKSDYPIYRIWKANQEVCLNESVIHLEDGGEHLLIWRKNLEVNIENLTEDEWQLLTAIAHHIKLGDICEQQAFASDIIAFLPKCIERGWITDFKIE